MPGFVYTRTCLLLAGKRLQLTLALTRNVIYITKNRRCSDSIVMASWKEIMFVMKEYLVTLNLLAENNEEAKKLSESICKYFLSDNMCTIESIRLKQPVLSNKKTSVKEAKEKAWLKKFGYSEA